MKYKVGDRVRIRKDLVIGMDYGGYDIIRIMSGMCGKTAKIKEVEDGFYLLEGCYDYRWTEEMLEEADEMKETGIVIDIITDGKETRVRYGDKVGIAKCSSEDKFNIFVGARLALKRLEEKCKPYGWLKYSEPYYIPSASEKGLCRTRYYNNDAIDDRMKKRGLVFKTEKEALEAAKKMLVVLKEG